MKIKYTFSIALAILFCALKAQTPYVKMLKEDTTTWQHYSVTMGVQYKNSQISTPQVDQNAYATLDTITINGKIYRKFYQVGFMGMNYNGKFLTGYLREDTVARKVFYKKLTTSPDELFYDFSLNVNDSVYLVFNNPSSNTGYYRVDSIVTRTINAGPRRHFYLRKHVGNSDPTVKYLEHIEGVGSTHHIAYIYGGYLTQWNFPISTTCKPNWTIGLTCKHDDNFKVFQTCVMTNTSSAFEMQGSSSCDFGYFIPGGLKNNDLERLVKIGPSPADDILQIQVESSYQQKDLILYDMSGKEIYNSNSPEVKLKASSIEVRTSDLANGIYLLQLNLNKKKISRPIVIQH